MLSKPSTVILPLVLLLCLWWKHQGWKKSDFIRTAPFFALALAMSALTIAEQRGQILKASVSQTSLSLAQRFVIAGKAPWFYASKVLWPTQLTFVYPHWTVNATSLSSWLPLAGLIAVAVLLWLYRRRNSVRAGLFAYSFFVAALLPVLGFFDVFYFRYSYVADHFQYLACIGLISLVVGTGAVIFESAGPQGRGLATVAGAIALLILGACTQRQARIYQDLRTLWSDTLTKNPQCWLAHNNLGNILLRDGNANDAIAHYEQALRIKPDYVEAHNNLGKALAQIGRSREAIAQYEEALLIEPNYPGLHNNLGIALYQSGQHKEAVAQFEQALRITPNYAEAHCSLAIALAQEGKLPEAIEHLEQAVRIKPDDAMTHYNLAIALRQTGRVPEAVEHLEQAVRINPDFTQARNALAELQALH